LQTFSAGVAVVARLLYPAAGPALRLIRVGEKALRKSANLRR